MRTKKRLFSILLSFAIALGSITSIIIPAFAAEAAQTGENGYMKFFVGTLAYKYQGFSVQGKNGDSWLSTTFGDEGFESAIRVDGTTQKFDSFAYGKEYTTGNVIAYITARLQDQKAYIDYTIINNNNTEKTVNIGSYGDVQIGSNDYAPVSAIDAGSILMTDGTNEFRLIPGSGDPFTTTWYGGYSYAGSKVFEDLDPKNPITNLDSGIAWSWTITIPANGTVKKTAILSAGAATTFTIRYNANGGSGTMTPTGAEYNTTVKLKKNEFAKEGYQFAGWDTNSAGTTVVYEDEAEITMPNTDTTLYAVWKNNPDITATATGFEGTYDGESHGITVNVTDPASGAVIKYGKTEGTYDLDSSPAITNVADSPLTVYFKVTAEGYKDYTGSAIVTISKKAASVKAKDQNIKIGDTVPDLSSPVLDTHYTVTGLVGEDKLTTDPTLAYSAAPDNTKAGTYTITPSGASAGDNYTISYETGTLTISNKQIQTITAEDVTVIYEDVTVIYGDKDKKITATTTGDGKLSYAVKSGDAVTVDKDTGALTIVEAGNAVITVTASETDTYAQATKDVTVTVAEEEKKPQQLAVKLTHYKDDGSYGVPSDIGETVWKLNFTLSLNDEEYSSAETAELAVKPGEKEQTITVLFPAELDMAKLSNDYKVTVSGYETTVKADIFISESAGSQDVPRYAVSIGDPSFINDEDGNVVLTLKVKWSGGKPQPKPEVIKVYALPEDEVGAYRLNDDGTKEYLLFHTYAICMNYLGSDELCRGYERCFHKESPYVNPFVKP
ncbi:MAG: InlB B-repeat-containing protein [Flexilinea sp.]|nr:InlB B-repeat-containing protein [Flexilinea sp.]